MKLPEWNRQYQQWDRYKAFYIGVFQTSLGTGNTYNAPDMVMFDTGEVIYTTFSPRPDARGHYSPLNVEVTTSRDYCGELYTPAGEKVAIAWLYDNGQESLLVDEDTKRVVRVSDTYRYNSANYEPIAGIPKRFQTGVSVYFPGEGMPPVPVAKIVAWLPFNKAALDKEQKAHIQMIVDTARAAMKLTDHPHTRTYASSGIMSGCPLDMILKSQTWQDIPECHLGALYHHGAQRKKVEYDYLLTEKP